MKKAPETFIANTLFESGIVHVIIARYKSNSLVEAGVFLLDVWCLGVKDAFFFKDDEAVFQSTLLRQVFGESVPEPDVAARGRKLIEDCVVYAQRLGFAPHPDYKKACRVFGGINVVDCDEIFSFGKNGKPFYLPGPHESHSRVHQIEAILERSCGIDGFETAHQCGGHHEGEDAENILFVAESHSSSDEPSPVLQEFVENYVHSNPQFSSVYLDAHPNLVDHLFTVAKTSPDDSENASTEVMPLEARMGMMIALHRFIQLSDDQRNMVIEAIPKEISQMLMQSYSRIVENGTLDSLEKGGLLNYNILDWKVIRCESKPGETTERLLMVYAKGSESVEAVLNEIEQANAR